MRVCIIGIGITSLTLAKSLVNQNIWVDLWAQKKTFKPDQSRTIGISKSNVDYINKNIVNIEKIIWKLKKIEIFTENLGKEKLLNFENKNNELFSILKNFKFFDLLEKSLSKNKYFKKIYLEKNLNFLENYDLVINTEYSNKITKKYFSKQITKKYNSIAYTVIITHKKILNNTASQIFTKRGPLAFLPISDTQTSIVYSLNNSDYIKNENIINLIHQFNFKYKIVKISKVKSFELKSLSLRSYFHNNILAFGDLLHKVHPLAGQGFNMTMRDIKLLLEIIKSKSDLGLQLDSSVNLDFENRIKHKNFIFSSGIDFIHEFFNLDRRIKSNALSKTVQFLGKNPIINKLFTKIADRGVII
jgi:2-octaprenyl-6-methoxyphenol hydroxylase